MKGDQFKEQVFSAIKKAENARHISMLKEYDEEKQDRSDCKGIGGFKVAPSFGDLIERAKKGKT